LSKPLVMQIFRKWFFAACYVECCAITTGLLKPGKSSLKPLLICHIRTVSTEAANFCKYVRK
jgi:hypothetical protein